MNYIIAKISKENYKKMSLVCEQQELKNIDEVLDYLLYIEGEL